MKKTLIIIGIALTFLAAGLFVRWAMSVLNHKDEIKVVEFSLPDTTGKTHAISEWQNKLRVINFWATWCPPCRDELPTLIELQKQYANKNVQLLGIAIDETEPVKQFLTPLGVNYPMLIAEQSGIDLAYNLGNFVGAIPYTIIVNRDNTVVFKHSGEISKEKLQAAIDEALEPK
jgi:thiol-disulfide isomerase/thioredoxin